MLALLLPFSEISCLTRPPDFYMGIEQQRDGKPGAGAPAIYRPCKPGISTSPVAAGTAPNPVHQPPHPFAPVQPKMVKAPAVPVFSTAKVVQQRKGAPRWTPDQHAARKADWDLISRQRAALGEIAAGDETYFEKYLRETKKYVTVYRGDGRGVSPQSWAAFLINDINPKPGDPEISFYGVVAHTHSNASPGGMVSTTSKLDIALHWALETHTHGMVWKIQLYDYIDVNGLLAARNFRNRYEGQHEFLIPRKIARNEIKRVYLYTKGLNGASVIVDSKKP